MNKLSRILEAVAGFNNPQPVTTFKYVSPDLELWIQDSEDNNPGLKFQPYQLF